MRALFDDELRRSNAPARRSRPRSWVSPTCRRPATSSKSSPTSAMRASWRPSAGSASASIAWPRRARPITLDGFLAQAKEGGVNGSQPHHQGRCAGFGRSAALAVGRPRQRRNAHARHPHRRRRHQRIGRHAGERVERDHHRIQHPARRHDRAQGRDRGRRRAPLRRHLQRHRRSQGGDDRHAQAARARGRARPSRSAPDIQGQQGRHDRRRLRHETARSTRDAAVRVLRDSASSTKASWAPSNGSRTMCAKWPKATNAAWRSRTSTT